MRKDISMASDSGFWGIVATGALERIIADNPCSLFSNGNNYPGDKPSNLFSFANNYEIAVFSLIEDGGELIRVVTNEPLTEQEAEQWIARIRWRLRFTEGKLIL